jgi:MYXO-CTERM domain-containing protein
LTATGGVPPIWWSQVGDDTSCLITGSNQTEMQTCSEYESLNGTTAAFQAGGQAGEITVIAIDTQGQEAAVKITVSGAAIDGGTLPTVDDAGPTGGPPAAPPLEEAGVVLSGSGEDGGALNEDGGIVVSDGSPNGAGGTNLPINGSSSSGCSCGVAGSQGSNEGALGALLLGLVAVGRRRRR